jgi:hypothetical protein
VEELMQNYKCLEIEISDRFADKLTQASEKVKAKIGANTDMWCGGAAARTF